MARLYRLDKFLCDQGIGTRSEMKSLLKKGSVTVNGVVMKTSDYKINPEKDTVCFEGKQLHFQEYYYYMLHKPAGVISATLDAEEKTVLDLLGANYRTDIFPVGRLDKDTEGLLLLTNDGLLAHKLLSPKKHVPKKYLIEIPEKLSKEQISRLELGTDIGEERLTAPAKLESIDDTHICLTITEGKYHQIKRMLHSVGSEVLYLKRIGFGALTLDETLPKGAYRPLTDYEVHLLRSNEFQK